MEVSVAFHRFDIILCDMVSFSRDGAKCSGLFCALSLVLDRVKLEGRIDVFHTVRKLQIRRPQIVQSIVSWPL